MTFIIIITIFCLTLPFDHKVVSTDVPITGDNKPNVIEQKKSGLIGSSRRNDMVNTKANPIKDTIPSPIRSYNFENTSARAVENVQNMQNKLQPNQAPQTDAASRISNSIQLTLICTIKNNVVTDSSISLQVNSTNSIDYRADITPDKRRLICESLYKSSSNATENLGKNNNPELNLQKPVPLIVNTINQDRLICSLPTKTVQTSSLNAQPNRNEPILLNKHVTEKTPICSISNSQSPMNVNQPVLIKSGIMQRKPISRSHQTEVKKPNVPSNENITGRDKIVSTNSNENKPISSRETYNTQVKNSTSGIENNIPIPAISKGIVAGQDKQSSSEQVQYKEEKSTTLEETTSKPTLSTVIIQTEDQSISTESAQMNQSSKDENIETTRTSDTLVTQSNNEETTTSSTFE